MYFVMYDKDLKALGKRKTYPVSTWSIDKKIFDFDSCKITGYPIEFDVNDAMFVTLNEDNGRIKYTALVGISNVKNGVTTINCSDLKTILNSEIVINFNQSFENITAVYTYLFSELISQNSNLFGFESFTIDSSDISTVAFDPLSIVQETAIGNVWSTLVGLNQYYNIYFTMDIDFINKTFNVVIKRMNVNRVVINKNDFELDLSQKVNTGINRVVCYGANYTSKTVYYLLRDNTIKVASDVSESDTIIYPAKVKVFQEDDVATAITNGKKELLNSRFDEKVEINLNLKMGYLFNDKGFDTLVNIVDYKELPIGEIKEDYKGNRSVILGIEKEEF